MRLASSHARNVCGSTSAAGLSHCSPIRLGESGNTMGTYTILYPYAGTIADVLSSMGYVSVLIAEWHPGGRGGHEQGPGTRLYKSELMSDRLGFDGFFPTPSHRGTPREVDPDGWKLVLQRPADPPWSSKNARMIHAVPQHALYDLRLNGGGGRNVAQQNNEIMTRPMRWVKFVRAQFGDSERVGPKHDSSARARGVLTRLRGGIETASTRPARTRGLPCTWTWKATT